MRILLASIMIASTACGTYSMVRPADTLPHGKFEVAAGVAASELEANSIIHGAVGVTDHVELLAQNEIWNTIAEVRYGILHSKDAPVAIAIGVGGGYATTLLSAVTSSGDSSSLNGTAGTVSLSIGHDWGRVALTVSNRTFLLTAGYLASSTRAGLRVRVAGPVGLFVEGGATYHASISLGAGFAIGEGAGGLFLSF